MQLTAKSLQTSCQNPPKKALGKGRKEALETSHDRKMELTARSRPLANRRSDNLAQRRWNRRRPRKSPPRQLAEAKSIERQTQEDSTRR